MALHKLDVATPQGTGGTLFKEADSYLFGYTSTVLAAAMQYGMAQFEETFFRSVPRSP